jgi:hypothetical protein
MIGTEGDLGGVGGNVHSCSWSNLVRRKNALVYFLIAPQIFMEYTKISVALS